jgi:hypothetical protein
MLINRLAACVFELVENSYEFTDEGFSYAEACEMIGLDDFETEAVLKVIDEDLRQV